MEGKHTKPNKYQRNVNEASDFDPGNLPFYRNLYAERKSRGKFGSPTSNKRERINLKTQFYIAFVFGSK